LFLTKLHCNNCHGGDNLNTSLDGEGTANIGLDQVYSDNGVGALTGNRSKQGVFKVPSLRNIALTAPYMHDGRFATLESIVEHYNNQLKNHENLFPSLRTFQWSGNGGGASSGGSGGWGSSSSSSFGITGLNLQVSEKAALVAFLKTLTDESLVSDERFSNPFKN
jgi:cytochrome c peroxidase